MTTLSPPTTQSVVLAVRRVERRGPLRRRRHHRTRRCQWFACRVAAAVPGTRQPFVVISPYAKKNYVSHVLITQASIPQFIEDNWLNGQRLGGGSFDATTGSIVDMFNFNKANSTALILDPTFGTVDTKDARPRTKPRTEPVELS